MAELIYELGVFRNDVGRVVAGLSVVITEANLLNGVLFAVDFFLNDIPNVVKLVALDYLSHFSWRQFGNELGVAE